MKRSGKMSRRDFLKATVATTAVAGLGLSGAPASGRVIGANDRINVGVIGCGGKGTGHLRDLVKRSEDPNNRLQVAAVCDIYRHRLVNAKAISGAEAFHDYREMLAREDLDAVFIATPDHWHAPMAIDAMTSGKDIYLEKPMTYTWQEAKEVARVAWETGRIVQVGAQSASDDRWWQANKLIKEGAIGKVLWTTSSYCRNSMGGEWNYHIDADANESNLDWKAFIGSAPMRPFDKERFFRWRKYWDYSGGIATDLCYHQLSHLMIALGPEFPTRVTGAGGIYVQHDRDVPDTYHTVIEYPSQHSVVLAQSMANHQGIPEYIRGHQATMYFERPGVVIRPEDEFKDKVQQREVAREPRANHMQNFLDCVRSRQKPHLDADTAYKIMTAIHLGVLSYRNSRMMVFDPEKEQLV